MKILVLGLLLLTGCVPTLPLDTLREYKRVLLATKSAYYAACVQLARTPESEGVCIVADTHLNAAVELYAELQRLAELQATE